MSQTNAARQGRSATRQYDQAPQAAVPLPCGEAEHHSGAPETGLRCAWTGASRWWFQALDRQRITSGQASWEARVVGIHEVRPHLWIQIESADLKRGVVLHVTLETRLDAALAAIAQAYPLATGLQFIDVPAEG